MVTPEWSGGSLDVHTLLITYRNVQATCHQYMEAVRAWVSCPGALHLVVALVYICTTIGLVKSICEWWCESCSDSRLAWLGMGFMYWSHLWHGLQLSGMTVSSLYSGSSLKSTSVSSNSVLNYKIAQPVQFSPALLVLLFIHIFVLFFIFVCTLWAGSSCWGVGMLKQRRFVRYILGKTLLCKKILKIKWIQRTLLGLQNSGILCEPLCNLRLRERDITQLYYTSRSRVLFSYFFLFIKKSDSVIDL